MSANALTPPATPPAPAYRVDGPAAITRDWRRFAHLSITLALMDWKLRFFGSVLGYFWSLLRPLMLFGILYFVFSQVLRVGSDVPDYPLQLLIGVLLFTYFSEVTVVCVTSLVDEEPLIRKVSFPRMVIPVAAALTASFNLVLNLVTIAAFIILGGVEPRESWIFVPIPLVLLIVLGTGVGMLVSALYVPFRDIKPIWDVMLQLLFYGSPVLYAIEVIPSETARQGIMCNPVAALIQQARHWLIDPSAPSASSAIGGTVRLAIPIGIAMAIGVMGIWVFRREAPRIAEEL